ncbi:hypothetical protein KDH_24750 [Dictyobacter sp. S3.2.2.5]|uniref:Thiamine pyrophosphate enzyme TPP-binding domain-containing protein n=1 Tax=Dictyobacter halimunensis TaxID=3026934 RepID=A0ABQ6FT48_9CHLR|nr:hypothetical protein KDH_24750 [Dictyobacter sp. S3.2.2.5]
MQIARGFGCEAKRIEQPQDLVPAIQQHLQAKGPTVLEVLIEQKQSSLL